MLLFSESVAVVDWKLVRQCKAEKAEHKEEKPVEVY